MLYGEGSRHGSEGRLYILVVKAFELGFCKGCMLVFSIAKMRRGYSQCRLGTRSFVIELRRATILTECAVVTLRAKQPVHDYHR